MAKEAEVKESPDTRLMYTAEELREIRKLQAIAHVEGLDDKEGEP